VNRGADAVTVGFVVAVSPHSQIKLAHSCLTVAWCFPTEMDLDNVHCRESRVGNGRDKEEDEREEEEK